MCKQRRLKLRRRFLFRGLHHAAGDGGVDAIEPDGIACSGATATTDPRCTEQFKNADLAVLKVVPDSGFVFTGWTVNDAQIKTASADTLFLTTMPTLAGLADILPPGTMLATVGIGCLSLTLQSVTFAGMSAELLQDDGTPYRATPDTPHWQQTADPSYRPAPVVFTAGSPVSVTATFAVEPADFAGELYIMGTGTDTQHNSHRMTFNPQKATLADGIASITLSAATTGGCF